MKKLEFKPENFPNFVLKGANEATSIAQKIFDQWWQDNIENAPQVHSHFEGGIWNTNKSSKDAFKAKLIDIQPIEQPKKTKQVWQWRLRNLKYSKIWHLESSLMDETEAQRLFPTYERAKHAGPFDVSE